jgi:hypothetical protein
MKFGDKLANFFLFSNFYLFWKYILIESTLGTPEENPVDTRFAQGQKFRNDNQYIYQPLKFKRSKYMTKQLKSWIILGKSLFFDKKSLNWSIRIEIHYIFWKIFKTKQETRIWCYQHNYMLIYGVLSIYVQKITVFDQTKFFGKFKNILW